MTIDEISRAVTAATGVGTFIVSLGVFLLSLWNRRDIGKVDAKLDEVHKSTNGKMDQLLHVVGDAERAKGVIEGKTIEKQKAAGNPPPAERP